jgi:hypothetical protein
MRVWDIAEKQIHPFQVGDCFQCSEHSTNDLRYLTDVVKNYRSFSLLEKYLLCCSTILHDIDKAIINYEREVKSEKKHGVTNQSIK